MTRGWRQRWYAWEDEMKNRWVVETRWAGRGRQRLGRRERSLSTVASGAASGKLLHYELWGPVFVLKQCMVLTVSEMIANQGPNNFDRLQLGIPNPSNPLDMMPDVAAISVGCWDGNSGQIPLQYQMNMFMLMCLYGKYGILSMFLSYDKFP
ncbi:hypothetical protein L6452_20659 [Arctium lappa]|uniref:Uncharacterized protein n=1 Tax=Arctium lappa TaxID=4217 RepID=A0ACB9BGD5_ARCLA|nr:hypothetical protein L6452_20659 [Arctium lappa]